MTFRNTSWAFLGRVLRPFEDVLQAKLMLRWVAIDRNGELSHRAELRRAHIVFAEAGDGNRDGN